MPNQSLSQSAGTSGSTSHSLLRRVRDQEPLAWERLVDLYTPLLAYWCRRSRLNPELAEDVIQEVFLAVAGSVGQFRHERPGDTFRGWLRTIFRSKVARQFRRPAPDAPGGSEWQSMLQEIPEQPDEEEHTAVIPDLYHRAMGLIEAEFQQQTLRAFWLTAVEGQPAESVAEQLGMTPGAVYTARWRVLRRLRQELGDE